MMYDQEYEIFLTANELKNLRRVFDIIGEENLKANYFTAADIGCVYSVYEKLVIALDEADLEGLPL